MAHVVIAMVLLAASDAEVSAIDECVERLDVKPVWSGHPVRFALLTHRDRQFVAFYDAERRMTVAARRLNECAWRFEQLPETLNWDSHNYATLAVDSAGCIHLSGNMHVQPLVYFRTAAPLDITTLERVPAMVGHNENRCTYPEFLHGPQGTLLFTYRDGQSGSGDQIYNAYDSASRTWRRLLDQPLSSGEGKMNAYFHGPKLGPDGYFHLCWVWRNTPDCATNHTVCYARSRDLAHWETSAGKPLTLPIVFATSEVVDPVPPGGGVLNGDVVLGFDGQKRVIISYLKYDDQGWSQIFQARREPTGWRIHQTSRWEYRWAFQGPGAIPVEIRIHPVRVDVEGRLLQQYEHVKYGTATWILDDDTLAPLGQMPANSVAEGALRQVESEFPGMEVQWAGDQGGSGAGDVRYKLRWETLPNHRDRPREGPLPPPSMLRVYGFRNP